MLATYQLNTRVFMAIQSFDCKRYNLSFSLMLLLKIFFVKCPYLCLVDYQIVYILSVIHFSFV